MNIGERLNRGYFVLWTCSKWTFSSAVRIWLLPLVKLLIFSPNCYLQISYQFSVFASHNGDEKSKKMHDEPLFRKCIDWISAQSHHCASISCRFSKSIWAPLPHLRLGNNQAFSMQIPPQLQALWFEKYSLLSSDSQLAAYHFHFFWKVMNHC